MRELIDIHCHIMPGVDDGSPSADTSLDMLRTAEAEGIRQIILTPHHKPMHRNVSPAGIIKRTADLQALADEAGINVKLYGGSEVYYSGEIENELETIMPLAMSRYMLLEFHPADLFSRIRNGIYQVQSCGFTVVLAHAERYREVVRSRGAIEELSDMGCLIQINADSVMGRYGFGIRHFSRTLLKKHLVSFIATDAHDNRRRAPLLKACADFTGRKYGKDYASEIFYENPMKILSDNTSL